MRNINKIRGCLTGGAAGDALGYAVEFLTKDKIFSMYGKKGITEYSLRNGIAIISDDTQMTLFTANGLLIADGRDYVDCIREMYKCWYRTQTESYPLPDKTESFLTDIPELFNKRSPGMTCMTEIKDGAKGTVKDPVNDSKGCGGVMRVAPVGLYFSDTETTYDQSDMIAAEAAALTHGHELGYIPASALAHIVRLVTESDIPIKDAVRESIEAVEKLFPDAETLSEFTEIMQEAVTLSESETNDLEAIYQLGDGWVAEETLAIAVYCALKYKDDFDKAIIASVNHDGDSDSTGAVCGNILGAYLGYDAIPQKYKDSLELHDLILQLSDDLCKK